MRTVLLPGTDRETTSIGFGCGGVIRIPDKAERDRLLEASFDLGIRHYDNARMYGLGQCEAETRPFLSRHRHDVTVTTKFGLSTGGGESTLRKIQGPVRKLLHTFPALRKIVRKAAGSKTVARQFTVEAAQASLETSLKEMGVERVDLFLAHDAEPADFDGAGLADLTARLRQEGKIGGTGVSGNVWPSIEVARAFPAFAEVVQVPHDVYQPQIADVRAACTGVVGTFSMLRRCLGPVKELMVADSPLRQEWSDRLGTDLSDDENLAATLIACSRAENPGGIALVYTSSPVRLKKLLATIHSLESKDTELLELTGHLRPTWSGGDPVREGF